MCAVDVEQVDGAVDRIERLGRQRTYMLDDVGHTVA